MSKKVIVLIVFITCLILIVFLINGKTKKKENENVGIDELELTEMTLESDSGNKYKVVYSELNLVYEIYDEYGNLVGISPDEQGVYEYVENPDLINSIN